MPRTTKIGDQWRNCARCDILTPLSRLHIEDGLKICDRAGCPDKYRHNYHERMVAYVLNARTEEGTDRTGTIYFASDDWDII